MIFFLVWTKKPNEGSCPWWWNRGCSGRLQHVLPLQRMAWGGDQGTSISARVSHVTGKSFHGCTLLSAYYYYMLIDWRGWIRCVRAEKKSEVYSLEYTAGLKVDLADSLLSNMVALDWSIMWFVHHVLEILRAIGDFLLISSDCFLNRWKTASSIALNDPCILLSTHL